MFCSAQLSYVVVSFCLTEMFSSSFSCTEACVCFQLLFDAATDSLFASHCLFLYRSRQPLFI